jgi:GNAT superfamily N-acetyltransferase
MSASTETFPLVDITFARRIEGTEALANRAFVEARARLEPSLGATWKEVGGAYALFDGVGSPLTQSFGLGMFTTADAAQLDELDAFFVARGAEPFYEVSPLADPTLLPLFGERGFRPVELTSALYQPLRDRELPATAPDSRVTVRRIDGGSAAEAEHWAATAAQGWAAESPALGEFVRALGRVNATASGNHCFLAELDGQAIGTGAMFLHEGVAMLAGASTIPSARRLGAQRALLAARLRFARESGCDLATMGAAPGGASQRNAERQGFRIAYTRIKWGR